MTLPTSASNCHQMILKLISLQKYLQCAFPHTKYFRNESAGIGLHVSQNRLEFVRLKRHIYTYNSSPRS